MVAGNFAISSQASGVLIMELSATTFAESRVVNQRLKLRLLCRVLATTIQDERKESTKNHGTCDTPTCGSSQIATWPGWKAYRGELLPCSEHLQCAVQLVFPLVWRPYCSKTGSDLLCLELFGSLFRLIFVVASERKVGDVFREWRWTCHALTQHLCCISGAKIDFFQLDKALCATSSLVSLALRSCG